MQHRILVSLFVSIMMLPAGVTAQGAQEALQGGIQLEIKQSDIPRRPIIHPVPPPAVAVEDARRVAADLEAARRQAEATRAAADRLSRRPDLDYDVANGIQQRNVLKSLPR